LRGAAEERGILVDRFIAGFTVGAIK